MSASYPTKLILAHRSGGICALCGAELTEASTDGLSTAVIGEAAHIFGEKPGAARYDANMTDEQRNDYPNLIYLCPTCHTTIDKLALLHEWPTDRLLKLKKVHEATRMTALEEAFAEVGFPELGKAMGWISTHAPDAPEHDFKLISPEEKIAKNSLSSGSRHVIASGLSGQKIVAQFVEAETRLDTDFPDRLKSGFLAEYYRLRTLGHRDDELFELMCSFAQRGAKTQATRTAGLAVLIYLFEICDVFEK